MRRVYINDYENFFKEILNGESLKEFNRKSKINYSTLKKWARGENLIPEDKFISLLKYSKNKSYWLKKVEYKKENWEA